ncbi:HD-GYP domain-containing protein [bacterium]|nr:HD-GYP domain-containing protein [bacterium]MBU2599843.1 HD-GYP domain-containing protein [bacterium]
MIYLKPFQRKKSIERACHDTKVRKMVDCIPTIISKDTQRAVINILEQITENAKAGKVTDNHEIRLYAKRLVEEVISNQSAMVNLEKIRNYDKYTLIHSINVCLLSVLTGFELNFSHQELEELALGAILHDLGKILIKDSILNKSDELNSLEFEEMKKHPYHSYCFLSEDTTIGEIPKVIAYQHHERYNGSGYPRSLSGNQINDYAVVTALADVYDALTTDRIYRKGFLPYEAMKIILSSSPQMFCSKITKAFVQSISIYPSGSLVKLNTGDIGIIIRVNKKSLLRPVVRLLLAPGKESYKEINDLDLSKELDYYITSPIEMEIC